jgi:hypothetical protein
MEEELRKRQSNEGFRDIGESQNTGGGWMTDGGFKRNNQGYNKGKKPRPRINDSLGAERPQEKGQIFYQKKQSGIAMID